MNIKKSYLANILLIIAFAIISIDGFIDGGYWLINYIYGYLTLFLMANVIYMIIVLRKKKEVK